MHLVFDDHKPIVFYREGNFPDASLRTFFGPITVKESFPISRPFRIPSSAI